MRTPIIAALAALPVLAFGTIQAQAGGWDRDCDRRYYRAPAYTYYQAPPAYTYYQPPRVVVAAPPAVVFYSPRVYAGPRYYAAGWRGWRGWDRGWDRRW